MNWSKLGPGNISIVYLYAVLFILFAIWIPDLWFDGVTQRTVLNITFPARAILAVALVVPLLAGAFDLSIAGTMSLSAIMVSWLIVVQGWDMWPAMGVALLVALAAGALNAFLVVWVRINSFIATLGTGAVLLAFAEYVSGGVQITGLPDSFKDLARRELFADIQIKIVYVLVIALVAWYVIEHTPIGRYLQATGDNPDAARLAGVQTGRYVAASLMWSALIAGFAGIMQTAQINAGNANVGTPFLLPAFAAAFLGSTQFKGRFNVWGAVAAVWVLASGVQGFRLAIDSVNFRRILDDLFFGVALILAVGFSQLLERYREHAAAQRRTKQAMEESTT